MMVSDMHLSIRLIVILDAVSSWSLRRKTNTLEVGVQTGRHNGLHLVLYSFINWFIFGSPVNTWVE